MAAGSQKDGTTLLPVNSSNADRFSKFFTVRHCS